MNNTIQTQLKHKSVREFTDDSISTTVIELLYKVAMRTATSRGLQASSLIRIRDPKLKAEISKICDQEFIVNLPELWIFIVDTYRNKKIGDVFNCKEDASKSILAFFQAYIDAVLMAQNVEVAAESFDLGTVYIGSIYKDIEKIIALLKLPKLTFPVIGLGFGYPAKNVSFRQKPRMGKELRVFENSYNQFSNYMNAMKEYDDEMISYYASREKNKKDESFSSLVANALSNSYSLNLLEKIAKQGFNIDY